MTDTRKVDAIMMQIGAHDDLTVRAAHAAAAQYCQLVIMHPEAKVEVFLTGFDDDPHELFEIPRVRRYIKWWARRLYFTTLPAAQASPLGKMSIGLLAKCGALRDVDPAKVEVTEEFWRTYP